MAAQVKRERRTTTIYVSFSGVIIAIPKRSIVTIAEISAVVAIGLEKKHRAPGLKFN